jgi:hypothetical protein
MNETRRETMYYYFEIDSPHRTQFVGVLSDDKYRTFGGIIEAEKDLKSILNPHEEKVIKDLARKPSGCEWAERFNGQRWAIHGWKKK